MSRAETQELIRNHFKNWRQMEEVDAMTEAQLDQLPYGAIELDVQGNILRYNATESAISGRALEEVIGKNFFTEVAPCTNVQEFAGRFRRGVEAGQLNEVFPYLFDFKMAPTRVWIRLYHSAGNASTWVFVTQERVG